MLRTVCYIICSYTKTSIINLGWIILLILLYLYITILYSYTYNNTNTTI